MHNIFIPEHDTEPLKISLQHWEHDWFEKNGISVDVLRLDKIHPEISGNKWFKLKFYLREAREENKTKLISFGGPYSNHLLALAAAGKMQGLETIGYVRGEKPKFLSPTLKDAATLGMEIRFLSRTEYNAKKILTQNNIGNQEAGALLIPEGGAGPAGVKGAEEILKLIPAADYTHICTAVGTGTTLAGILNTAGKTQKIIGVSVLRGTTDFQPLNISWLTENASLSSLEIIHEDHFGGYARSNPSLLKFMNEVYEKTGIPTDFVYTGKLFYSIVRMAGIQAFVKGSRILVIHSGGLQGNRSLSSGLLQY